MQPWSDRCGRPPHLPPPDLVDVNGCSTNHYMPHYTPPRFVSVRLPGDVSDALKAYAKDEASPAPSPTW
jgi:hypothetical protein